MLMNLPLVSLSLSYTFGIDVVTAISPILRINFAKIHTNCKTREKKNLEIVRSRMTKRTSPLESSHKI